MKAALRSWFRNLFRRQAVENSLDEELRACVDILAAHKEQAGLSPAEARRQALLEIGGVEIVKERVRDVRRESRSTRSFATSGTPRAFFRKQPLLTVAIVLTLGIGLGSPASAFSLLNHYIFAPPPNPDALGLLPSVQEARQRTRGGGQHRRVPRRPRSRHVRQRGRGVVGLDDAGTARHRRPVVCGRLAGQLQSPDGIQSRCAGRRPAVDSRRLRARHAGRRHERTDVAHALRRRTVDCRLIAPLRGRPGGDCRHRRSAFAAPAVGRR